MRLNFHRQGSGEPLVLLHGIGGEWQVWAPLLERLSQERDVIAVDIPGVGASAPLANGVTPTPQALAAAVGHFLDDLAISTAHLAGNSLGGWIALELAKVARGRSVTALSPAGNWENGTPLYCTVSLRINRRMSSLPPGLRRLVVTRPVRAVAFRQISAYPGRIPVAAAHRMAVAFATAPGFETTLGATRRLHFVGGERIEVPVTVAWGDRDRLLLRSQSRRSEHLPPAARTITLAGCGHIPMWDNPEQVARTILDGSAT